MQQALMCDLRPRLRRGFLLFTRSKTDRDHNLPTVHIILQKEPK
jgi:hypothetical protein